MNELDEDTLMGLLILAMKIRDGKSPVRGHADLAHRSTKGLKRERED
jgi:hypothetical protein